MHSRPSRRFSQNSSMFLAPGKRQDMPMMAMSESCVELEDFTSVTLVPWCFFGSSCPRGIGFATLTTKTPRRQETPRIMFLLLVHRAMFASQASLFIHEIVSGAAGLGSSARFLGNRRLILPLTQEFGQRVDGRVLKHLHHRQRWTEDFLEFPVNLSQAQRMSPQFKEVV